MLILILLLTIWVVVSTSLRLKTTAAGALLECSKFYRSMNKNNLVAVFDNMADAVVLIDDHIADSNWEKAVLDGLEPLSQHLKAVSLSTEISNTDFKRYLLLASKDIAKATEVTGCIVQAAVAGESLTNGGENIIKAGESLKVSCSSVAMYIIDVGECISTFGMQLSNGKFI
jgi:hypothetical protein